MTEPISGKTVLITGATSDIGLEASAKLAGMGAELVLVWRDRTRGEAAVAAVKRRSGSTGVALMRCDFTSLTQIRTKETAKSSHPGRRPATRPWSPGAGSLPHGSYLVPGPRPPRSPWPGRTDGRLGFVVLDCTSVWRQNPPR
jgi:hypothetical protein